MPSLPARFTDKWLQIQEIITEMARWQRQQFTRFASKVT
jgi:hypothetical protein